MASSDPTEQSTLESNLASLNLSDSPDSTSLTGKETAQLDPGDPLTPSSSSACTLDLDEDEDEDEGEGSDHSDAIARPPGPLVYETVLHYFHAGRAAWDGTHTRAIETCLQRRIAIATRVTQLLTVKEQRTPELNIRSCCVKFLTVPEANYLDWSRWCAFLCSVDALIDHADRHANWFLLLEMEYQQMTPLWEQFWTEQEAIERETGQAIIDTDEEEEDEEEVEEEEEAGKENENVEDGQEKPGKLDHAVDQEQAAAARRAKIVAKHKPAIASLLARLSAHNVKRAFLHRMVRRGDQSHEMRAFWGEGEPEWMEW